jgi:hypothetical protein
LVAADVNEDGRSDLVYGAGAAINLLLGNGDGTFAVKDIAAPVDSLIDVRDVDGDGHVDIAALGGSGPTVALDGHHGNSCEIEAEATGGQVESAAKRAVVCP